MRSDDDYRAILQLWAQGYNKYQIAKLTGIPRATVRDCIERYSTPEALEKAIVARTKQQEETQQRRQAKRKSKMAKPRPWRYTEDQLRQVVKESRSIAQALEKLNLKPAGGNYATFKKRIASLNIDTSHFRGQGWLKDRHNFHTKKRPMAEILVKDSTYTSTHNLRTRLINEGYFEHRCQHCGLDTWVDQPIPLELDHINGDRHDHRLENLRLLCPNCHALTPTYRGRNMDPNNSSSSTDKQ